MPAGLMLKNRMANEFTSESQVLTLSREGLAVTGLAVARVTARAVEPLPGSYAGIIVRLDGAEPLDRTPEDDPALNPLSAGTPNYNFYSVEVVQRIGYDSFTPDNGVLLAKNKDQFRGNNGGPNGFNSFIWVIDAHPEDMETVDYVKPNGDAVMRTVADYRQLNDALFHAGTDSGSDYEWIDEANRLHFYVVDLVEDTAGIRSYTLAVRSLDRRESQTRGVEITGSESAVIESTVASIPFTLRNTGTSAPSDPALHPSDATSHLNSDLYRLSVSIQGEGWSARLPNALAAMEVAELRELVTYVTATPTAEGQATLTIVATSESDPSVQARLVVTVAR